MGVDVWKFVLNGLNLRKRAPILKCESGQPVTHRVLADAECDHLGSLKVARTFVCKDGVDTRRLLQLVRTELFSNAREWGVTALVDESWTCTVFRRKKGIYKVRVTYEAGLANACKPSPPTPVAIKEAKGIPGMMTIVSCT